MFNAYDVILYIWFCEDDTNKKKVRAEKRKAIKKLNDSNKSTTNTCDIFHPYVTINTYTRGRETR